MHPNQQLIETFYTAFANGDAETMAQCYHQEVIFNDPAFRNLKGDEAADMWRMLISRAKGELEITFSNVSADDQNGTAHWEAKYRFGKARRKVHNKIDARFIFEDGKIIEHTDSFPFWKWSKMALGPLGLFLGWTPFLRKKVQQQSARFLQSFRNN